MGSELIVHPIFRLFIWSNQTSGKKSNWFCPRPRMHQSSTSISAKNSRPANLLDVLKGGLASLPASIQYSAARYGNPHSQQHIPYNLQHTDHIILGQQRYREAKRQLLSKEKIKVRSAMSLSLHLSQGNMPCARVLISDKCLGHSFHSSVQLHHRESNILSMREERNLQ